MLQSLAEGFAIVGVMAVFGAFNSVVSHSELVQSTPRAFYELGLVVVVALAFVPSTITAIHDVREADRARTGGRVVRRGRLLRQVVPVLEHGLERAVTLAESMDSRGFARGGREPARPRRRVVRARRAARCSAARSSRSIGEPARSPPCSGSPARSGSSPRSCSRRPAPRPRRYRPRRMARADWVDRRASRARRRSRWRSCRSAGDEQPDLVRQPAALARRSHLLPALALPARCSLARRSSPRRAERHRQ